MLAGLSTLLVGVCLYLVFVVAPVEQQMGIVQKIFYFHVPSAYAMYVAWAAAAVGSLLYLWKRDERWDALAVAGAEVGMVYCLIVLTTGPLWARKAWGVYWTWDPRLTTSTITVLVYLAYLLFRNGIDNRQTRARFGSIYAILAFLSVPLTFYSARLFRSIHPVVYGNENPDAQGGFSVGASMTQTLMISMIGFCILFSALVILRWRQLGTEDALAELREDLE